MIQTFSSRKSTDSILDYVAARNQNEPEFLQAVTEFVNSVMPYIAKHPKYIQYRILERIVEPERVISFRVVWQRDNGEIEVNRGYRVEYNSAIGPYKGGLRFHPSVNLSILKFLGFEQIFKNSLTSLPMGGGKGGSDFDPKGKSDAEVMRFCQAFMSELFRHIGPNTDVPAGDIGVGGREIGYMFGQYKKLTNEFNGVLTGKGISFGGSLIRPEATGYGLIYFVQNMLQHQGTSLTGKKCVVSGSGNVAQYAIEKALEMGASVHTVSDSSGFVYDRDGITYEKLAYIAHLKNEKRGRIKEFADAYNLQFYANEKPWNIACDVALPCATQNEILAADAKRLVLNECKVVGEGANMPTDLAGQKIFHDASVLFAPAKAANAGGVAVSGLEMSQNSLRMNWTREEVNNRLQGIMSGIHEQCLEYGENENGIDYVKGSNIAGFVKVADAMIAQGLV